MPVDRVLMIVIAKAFGLAVDEVIKFAQQRAPELKTDPIQSLEDDPDIFAARERSIKSE